MEKHNSDYWQAASKWLILDPDGYDRVHFEESWAEEITEAEFNTRLLGSTIQLKPL